MTLTIDLLEKKLAHAKKQLEKAEADCASTNAEIRFGGNVFAKAAQDEIYILTLAKRGLATMPRPISEAPKDGTKLLLIEDGKFYVGFWALSHLRGYEWTTLKGGIDPSHFIHISALEQKL